MIKAAVFLAILVVVSGYTSPVEHAQQIALNQPLEMTRIFLQKAGAWDCEKCKQQEKCVNCLNACDNINGCLRKCKDTCEDILAGARACDECYNGVFNGMDQVAEILNPGTA